MRGGPTNLGAKDEIFQRADERVCEKERENMSSQAVFRLMRVVEIFDCSDLRQSAKSVKTSRSNNEADKRFILLIRSFFSLPRVEVGSAKTSPNTAGPGIFHPSNGLHHSQIFHC